MRIYFAIYANILHKNYVNFKNASLRKYNCIEEIPISKVGMTYGVRMTHLAY